MCATGRQSGARECRGAGGTCSRRHLSGIALYFLCYDCLKAHEYTRRQTHAHTNVTRTQPQGQNVLLRCRPGRVYYSIQRADATKPLAAAGACEAAVLAVKAYALGDSDLVLQRATGLQAAAASRPPAAVPSRLRSKTSSTSWRIIRVHQVL